MFHDTFRETGISQEAEVVIVRRRSEVRSLTSRLSTEIGPGGRLDDFGFLFARDRKEPECFDELESSVDRADQTKTRDLIDDES